MKIIETIEMTPREKSLCEEAAQNLTTIQSNLCDAMECNGMHCSQCPISKAIDSIAGCSSRLFYIARYGTNKGYGEP